MGTLQRWKAYEIGFASGKFNEFYQLYESGDEGAAGCIGELSDVVWAIIMQSLGEGEAQLYFSNAGLTAFHGGKPTEEVRINVERRIRRINDLIARIDHSYVSE